MKIRTASEKILRRLENEMSIANQYSEWHAMANDHDILTGASGWREATTTNLYDYIEISKRYNKLMECLSRNASQEILYALNEGVHGNMGGMGKPILYSKAKAGTKHLVEKYVDCIETSLIHIRDCPENEIPFSEKFNFFRRASHCYGKSALLLSGGAGLIYFHHGVVQELIDSDLLPNVISGASAGSAVSAQLGTLTDDELKDGYFSKKRYQEVNNTRLIDVMLGRVGKTDAKIAREKTLDEFVSMDMTFQEAYEKTGRYINISISPMERHQTSRLMNAITSPNVYIRSAVSASSSIPGVIPPERLYAKGMDGKPRPYLASRRWVDGSFSQDLPVKRLSRLYGVNHFIVSLINPMVVPFIEDIKTKPSSGIRSTLSKSSLKIINEALSVIERNLYKSGSLGSTLAGQLAYIICMLEQDYLGDVNIILNSNDFKWRQILFEFKDNEIEELISIGRRKTWPKVSMLKNSMRISKLLDETLEGLDKKRVANPDEIRLTL